MPMRPAAGQQQHAQDGSCAVCSCTPEPAAAPADRGRQVSRRLTATWLCCRACNASLLHRHNDSRSRAPEHTSSVQAPVWSCTPGQGGGWLTAALGHTFIAAPQAQAVSFRQLHTLLQDLRCRSCCCDAGWRCRRRSAGGALGMAGVPVRPARLDQVTKLIESCITCKHCAD